MLFPRNDQWDEARLNPANRHLIVDVRNMLREAIQDDDGTLWVPGHDISVGDTLLVEYDSLEECRVQQLERTRRFGASVSRIYEFRTVDDRPSAANREK